LLKGRTVTAASQENRGEAHDESLLGEIFQRENAIEKGQVF
jgi:hypothetical protein